MTQEPPYETNPKVPHYERWLELNRAQLRVQYDYAGLTDDIQTFEDYCERVYSNCE